MIVILPAGLLGCGGRPEAGGGGGYQTEHLGRDHLSPSAATARDAPIHRSNWITVFCGVFYRCNADQDKVEENYLKNSR